MNIASVNYHFGDKEQLYLESIKRAHACADGFTDTDNPVPEMPAALPPEQKLRAFIGVMAGRMLTPARTSAVQLLMREMANPSPAAATVILQYIRPKAFLLRDILTEMFPTADPRHVLMVGHSVIGQILFYRQNRPVVELIFGKDRIDALDVTLVTEHVTRFTLAALGYAPPLREHSGLNNQSAEANRPPAP
ncbi:Transcriptional regulator, TetR family [Fimbriiglobus ruber]|uniref:Transcriptional regulator, TetR family n=2 Tax=Fimbriiglobus ruber TaxID=1908690 RepID=A0A225E158_9BACT|nr:Transcriptional regulator, TetR family [Fimbriiglobus ruber]